MHGKSSARAAEEAANNRNRLSKGNLILACDGGWRHRRRRMKSLGCVAMLACPRPRFLDRNLLMPCLWFDRLTMTSNVMRRPLARPPSNSRNDNATPTAKIPRHVCLGMTTHDLYEPCHPLHITLVILRQVIAVRSDEFVNHRVDLVDGQLEGLSLFHCLRKRFGALRCRCHDKMQFTIFVRPRKRLEKNGLDTGVGWRLER